MLFLDEPTSGLDPGMDKSVMHTLRGLADDGRTVVVVTHNVANLALCDRVLLLAAGGWVAFYGSPVDALAHFGQTDFAEVFQLLQTQDGEYWARRFAGSRPPAPIGPRSRRLGPRRHRENPRPGGTGPRIGGRVPPGSSPYSPAATWR